MATASVFDSSRYSDRWDLPDIVLVPMDSLQSYFNRLQSIALLSRDEEMDLGHAIQAGDHDAAVRLTLHNLRYAAHCARKWERTAPGSEAVWGLGDAVQAANIGLWTAVQRYDPAVARLTTYATWWIRQVWNRARNDFLWQIRLPTHAAEEWHVYHRVWEAWKQSRGTEPTTDEMVELLGWPATRVAFWHQWRTTQNHVASLDAMIAEYDSVLGDFVADPLAVTDTTVWDRLQQHAQREAVDHLLERLKPREADVLRLRFGLSGAPMTLQEIGDVFRLTRERIRQIEAKALKTLRAVAARHPEWELRDLIN